MKKYVVLRSFIDKEAKIVRKKGELFEVEDDKRGEYIESYSLKDPYVRRIDNIENPEQAPKENEDPEQASKENEDPEQTKNKRERKNK